MLDVAQGGCLSQRCGCMQAHRPSGFPLAKDGACPDFVCARGMILLRARHRNFEIGRSLEYASEIPSEREPMPFVRAIRRPAMAAPEGVHFHLDAVGGRSRLVHCIATRAGLEFLAGRQLTIDQLEGIFHLHRLQIEAVARRKSETASAGGCVLTIASSDLSVKGPETPCVDRSGSPVAHRDHL
jgi:hypothetical protein